ncbi:lytic transglycosylase domain-containing protein [Pseudohalioglobus sediminis]|uniref:Lytic transglycosylase domain-containing protein n=1 Tax=Pseudohalioglobus sediminis TaxID=2606449 RepID=A0A5B0WSU2_9GAMM|nr:transglycosylase SLT domain-containing protein [Pseudohalioglobus sediminis]KAA1190094.1 lytic transglycosylase domain-containing protein [Pseudohalioglobus sediminis]
MTPRFAMTLGILAATFCLNASANPGNKLSVPFIECFDQAANKHGLPLALLMGVARAESNFDPLAYSHANAVGVMQIQWPGTAKDLGITRMAVLLDPCTNIDAGARYLKYMLEEFKGDPRLALAAYNMGPNALRKRGMPGSVEQYVDSVLGYREHYQTLKPLRLEVASSRYTAIAGWAWLPPFGSAREARAFSTTVESIFPGIDLALDTTAKRVRWRCEADRGCKDAQQWLAKLQAAEN